MKKRVKRTFSIHHWCGLVAGIFILVISLTGSILVFDDEIDDAVFAREATLDSPASDVQVDKSLEWVRQQNPGWEIRVPALPASSTEALHYELRQGQLRKWIFVHPATGEELATIKQAHNRFTYVVLNIHYNLLSGTPGKVAVLLVGVSLLFLTITGLMLYRKSILKVITFRQKISTKSRRSFYSSMHRLVGVWSLVFNLFMCVTGLSLAITVLNSALKGGNSEIATPALPFSVDAALAQAKTAYPDFNVTYLRFPKAAGGPVLFIGRHKDDPSYYGKFYSNLQVNATSGEIEKKDFLRDKPWFDRLLVILHPLHFGDFAGLLLQIIYCIGGLMPGILSISGFVIWYYRDQSSKTTRKQISKPSQELSGVIPN